MSLIQSEKMKETWTREEYRKAKMEQMKAVYANKSNYPNWKGGVMVLLNDGTKLEFVNTRKAAAFLGCGNGTVSMICRGQRLITRRMMDVLNVLDVRYVGVDNVQ